MTNTGPKFTLVTLLSGQSQDKFEVLLESIVQQDYEKIELIVFYKGDSPPRMPSSAKGIEVLIIPLTEHFDTTDIWEKSIENSSGDYVSILENVEKFEPHALKSVSQAITAQNAQVVYSDFFVEVPGSIGHTLIELPEFSPELLKQQCYLGPQTYIELGLLRDVFSRQFVGKKDLHAVFLGLSSAGVQFTRIERALYSQVLDSIQNVASYPVNVEAVNQALKNEGFGNYAYFDEKGRLRIQRNPDLSTSVSVVIPTMGSSATIRNKENVLVVEAVRSLLEKSKHQNVEIVVVYDSITPKTVLDELREVAGDKLELVEFTEKFNFSKKCNVGAVASKGDILIFLNDDVEIITDSFIETLISPLSNPAIGQVGVTMFFEDESLQHGGHVYSHGVFMHAFLGINSDEYVNNSWLHSDREVIGVTAACTAVRREVFEEVGGFWENLPGNFNDVDFSLKIRSRGLTNLMLSNLKIFHFESKTRDTKTIPGEVESIQQRWGRIWRDPFFPSYLN